MTGLMAGWLGGCALYFTSLDSYSLYVRESVTRLSNRGGGERGNSLADTSPDLDPRYVVPGTESRKPPRLL